MVKGINAIILIFFLLSISCSRGISNKLAGSRAEIPAKAITALSTEEDLDLLLANIGDSRIVLLGESSHGTSEFYIWRDKLSRRLIQEKGFKVIAIEGDWEDASALNDYINNKGEFSSAKNALAEFDRWPQWMWANRETEELGEWLRNFNSYSSSNEQVAFYGLDLYGLWESLDAVHYYLKETEPRLAAVAEKVKECFANYDNDEGEYARATQKSSQNCADELAALLEAVQQTVKEDAANEPAAFHAVQNTYVAVNAEKYYRLSPQSNVRSWNVRDNHMWETIDRVQNFHGADTKIIVWEHNTHVGDARATDMANVGMVNIGQLAREHSDPGEVYIIGFGTYRGKVIAASSWGAARQVMYVPRARKNSWEWILHHHLPENKIIDMSHLRENSYFQNALGHRAIGVVYDPEAESGNYVPSVLPDRYDAFIFIDQTSALNFHR